MTIFGITMGIGWALFFIVLGAGLVIGAFIGAVLLLAKAIFDNNAHDINTCGCVACQQRRYKRHDKYQTEREEYERTAPKHNTELNLKKPTDNKNPYVSTRNLRGNDIVVLPSGLWRVEMKLPLGRGMSIVLRSVDQQRRVIQQHIRHGEMDQEVWQVRPKDWGGN